MAKYYIESVYNDRLKENLTFGKGHENLLLFDSHQEAAEAMVQYGCVHCHVKQVKLQQS